MTGNEYLQFMTRKFSHFITSPTEKFESHYIQSLEKRSFDKRDWFGNIPLYLLSLLQQRR